MGHRGWQARDSYHPSGRRQEYQHVGARRSVGSRPTRDDETAANSCHRCVSERRRKTADDSGAGSRSPGHDRVEPALPCVATDDVGGVGYRGGCLIRARRRQAPYDCRRTRGWIDADDLVVLADTISATEDVSLRAQLGATGIVQRDGELADHSAAGMPDGDDSIGRGIRSGEPAHEEQASGRVDRGCRILDRSAQSPCRRRDHVNRRVSTRDDRDRP